MTYEEFEDFLTDNYCTDCGHWMGAYHYYGDNKCRRCIRKALKENGLTEDDIVS